MLFLCKIEMSCQHIAYFPKHQGLKIHKTILPVVLYTCETFHTLRKNIGYKCLEDI
jgi:hypothetical protein